MSDGNENIAPIFIIGSPRSGTTVLYSILAQHPSLGWFSKKDLLEYLDPEFVKFVSLRRHIFDQRDYHYPLDEFGPRFFTTIEPPIEHGFLWDEVIPGYWNAKINQKKVEFLKNCIQRCLERSKKTRFIAKNPKHSIQIKQILEIFPDAKFIHIVRDGRAVVNSMISRSKENPSEYFGIPLKGIHLKMTNLEKHALQWTQIIEAIHNYAKLLEKNQFYEVKYEELVERPEDYLTEMTKFCGLEKFDYAYIKNNISFNLKNKDPWGWELMTIKILEDPNKKYKKNSDLEKLLQPMLNEMKYI